MSKDTTVFISLGSNTGNRAWILQQALFRLGRDAGALTSVSPVYRSPSWGFEGGEFLNLCTSLRTVLPPEPLLDLLLEIERDFGRVRNVSEGYQDRTLDLDILYFGEEIIQSKRLQVPHPRLDTRAFILKPLADIAPQHYHPVLAKDSRNLLQACKNRSEVHRTGIRLFPDREALWSELGFVAIEGNIGAGKTTLATKIAEDFNAKLILERFADNPFLPKFYEDRERYAFPLEMSFLADRYQQYTEDTRQLDLFKRFMVSDYDIYKSLIFAKITLQQDEFKLYRKLFGFMYSEVRKPKLYVYLYLHTDRLLEQIARRGRPYERSIPAEYLEKIHRGYFDFMKNAQDLNTLVIDLEELDFVARDGDYQWVLDRMAEHYIGSMNVKL